VKIHVLVGDEANLTASSSPVFEIDFIGTSFCSNLCSPEDIERFREEMVKHQPQLAAAASLKTATADQSGTDAEPESVVNGDVSPSEGQVPTNGEVDIGDGDKIREKHVADASEPTAEIALD
jgi:hypothetical protein